MSRSVTAEIRRKIRADYAECCAYCQSAEALVAVTFEVEHIVPVIAGGKTVAENLCLACPMCNRFKGSRTSAIDSETKAEAPLFHPRLNRWKEHFAWDIPGVRVIGLSPTGRATVEAFQINREQVVRLRELWVRLGEHPPSAR